MKNPKIMYIAISVFCVVVIAAGIYSEFFIKKENKDNTIISNNTTGDNTIPTEKTSEEIKAEFNNLFTNTFHKGNYNTANIQKIKADKDIVYAAYDLQDKKENYEVTVHLPVVNIIGDVPTSFNNITQTVFANKASEIMNSQKTEKVIYQVDYTSYINENILSVVIRSTLKEGNNPQRIMVQTYNYNLVTGEKDQIADTLDNYGITKDEAQKKINKVITQAAEEANTLLQAGYSVYNRDLNNSIYKVENVTNYFLGETGEIYIIFAYGNQNYTSEIDIVVFE